MGTSEIIVSSWYDTISVESGELIEYESMKNDLTVAIFSSDEVETAVSYFLKKYKKIDWDENEAIVGNVLYAPDPRIDSRNGDRNYEKLAISVVTEGLLLDTELKNKVQAVLDAALDDGYDEVG